MDLSLGLYQQQQTKLLMTPELRQSITVLQYALPELIQFLHEKAEGNPLLDIEEPAIAMDWSSLNTHEKQSKVDQGRKHIEYDRDLPSTWLKEDFTHPLDYYVEQDESLITHLKNQLHLLHFEQGQRKLVQYIIGNIDENGYLDLEASEAMEKLHCTEKEFENAVKIVQQLDPSGVAARSLEECLLIQLQHMEWCDALSEEIIRNYLKDLGAKRYQKIAKELKVKTAEVQQVAEYISTLNPKPGQLFQHTRTRYVIPDVYIALIENEAMVQVNDQLLPKLIINEDYLKLDTDGEAKKYLEEKKQEIGWLQKSLKHRQQTLLKVTQSIVNEQQAFFQSGRLQEIKPLTLKQIAEKCGIHESTVSRATNQKYAQTPWGLFELKFFFSNKASIGGDDDTSAQTVKAIIQQAISQENKQKPLSDSALVKHLAQQGITIARRTVAKYRDELGILSSSQRKQL